MAEYTGFGLEVKTRLIKSPVKHKRNLPSKYQNAPVFM